MYYIWWWANPAPLSRKFWHCLSMPSSITDYESCMGGSWMAVVYDVLALIIFAIIFQSLAYVILLSECYQCDPLHNEHQRSGEEEQYHVPSTAVCCDVPSTIIGKRAVCGMNADHAHAPVDSSQAAQYTLYCVLCIRWYVYCDLDAYRARFLIYIIIHYYFKLKLRACVRMCVCAEKKLENQNGIQSHNGKGGRKLVHRSTANYNIYSIGDRASHNRGGPYSSAGNHRPLLSVQADEDFRG